MLLTAFDLRHARTRVFVIYKLHKKHIVSVAHAQDKELNNCPGLVLKPFRRYEKILLRHYLRHVFVMSQ